VPQSRTESMKQGGQKKQQRSAKRIVSSIIAVVYSSYHIQLPAKLLDYFLRSNKSNINRPSKVKHVHLYAQTCTYIAICANTHYTRKPEIFREGQEGSLEQINERDAAVDEHATFRALADI